jgi:hypothetical protein
MRTITTPGITFTSGSGHIADIANAKTKAPTRRPVSACGSTHLGRLSASMARSAGCICP